MNIVHIHAVLLTLIIYIFIAVSYLGWGRILARIADRECETISITTFIWTGWAFTLFIFQLIYFILPLTAFVVIPVFMAGVIFAVPQILTAYQCCMNQFTIKKLIIFLIVIAFMVVFVAWLASRSMLPAQIYDSGLYHFNKIRWINSFPIVPGLGNLHGRLAFNQSFFTYAAALNFYPFFEYGRSVANSFLIILALATFIESLLPVFKHPYLLIEAHPYKYLSVIISFPALLYLAFFSDGIMSPSPDLTCTILQFVIFIGLVQDLGEWETGQIGHKCRMIFLCILAATTITIKLSNLIFSAVIIGFIIFYAMKFHDKKTVARLIIMPVMIILVWCWQSIILSGAPLYPSTFGYLPVDWAMPKEKIAEQAYWIIGWGRQPDTDWRNVIGNWNWLRLWFIQVSGYTVDVVFPVIVSVLFCLITVAIHCFTKRNRSHNMGWAIILPPFAGFTYWFFTAPAPRFAHALFFITMTCSAILFLSLIKPMTNRRVFLAGICVVFMIVNFQFFRHFIKNKHIFKDISYSGWHPARIVPLVKKITLSGLTVYTPMTGNQCWDSNLLPSTPYFNDHLKLRNPERMSSGFTVKGEKE